MSAKPLFAMLCIRDIDGATFAPFLWTGEWDLKYYLKSQDGKSFYSEMCVADTPENRQLIEGWCHEYAEMREAINIGRKNTKDKLKKLPGGYDADEWRKQREEAANNLAD